MIVVLVLIGAGVVTLGSTILTPRDEGALGDENATSSDSTATTTDEVPDEVRLPGDDLPDDSGEAGNAYTPPDDVPDVVAIPEGKHCGEGNPLPSTKAGADMDELECIGEALLACETAYLTDTKHGAYFSVPEQENSGLSCEARVKFRHPSEVATIETLRTANGELVCPLDALVEFMQESSNRDITFEGADSSSYAVRTYYMLFHARADLINKNKNEPAEQILRENCTGNLVTQTME